MSRSPGAVPASGSCGIGRTVRLADETETQRLRGSRAVVWTTMPDAHPTEVESIPLHATHACLHRVKDSHDGISKRRKLQELVAYSVNQDYLDEICELRSLEFLHLGHPVTATDLAGVSQLENLHTLRLQSVRHIEDFSPLLSLPRLHTLMIEHAKHLSDIEFLSGAHHLRVIGVEGSMWTHQRVASLQPLSGLRNLEALFMTSVRLKDKDLTYLAGCPKLRILDCARFAPKRSFDALRAAMPDLACSWCDDYEINF